MLRIFSQKKSKMDSFFLFLVIGSSFFISSAHAITTLKKVNVVDANQIDLIFDSKIQNSQIQTEYLNDIIQISLNDVSVYPAKMNALSGPDFVKVFAYQYSPRQVRCRFTVKGKAENYQGKIEIKANGKQISVRSLHGGVTIPMVSPKISNEEKSLLERVLKSESAETAVAAATVEKKPNAVAPIQTASVNLAPKKEASSSKLTNGKPLPGIGRSLGVLIVICLMFASVAYALKRGLRGPRLEKNRKLHKFLNTMGKSLGIGLLGKKGKVVEVIANHYLGPKKSISVVKIAGKTLVLGVTSENINLIAQLDRDLEDEEVDEVLLDSLGASSNAGNLGNSGNSGKNTNTAYNSSMASMKIEKSASQTAEPQFSDLFQDETSRPQVKAPIQNSGVRDRIRSRIEGMKSL